MVKLGKLLGGLALALLLPWWLNRELTSRTAELAGARSDLERALDANQSLEGTIALQATALEGWRQAANANGAAAELAVADARRDAAAAAAASQALKARESEDAKLPECAKLLALDLAGVCPGHALGLLERAHRDQGPGELRTDGGR